MARPRMIVVAGPPGSGKTTARCQPSLARARAGETGLAANPPPPMGTSHLADGYINGSMNAMVDSQIVAETIGTEAFKGIAAGQHIDFAPLTLLFGASSGGERHA